MMKKLPSLLIGLLSVLLLSHCGGGANNDGDGWRSFSASIRNFVYGNKSFILTNGNTVIIKSRYEQDDPDIIGPDGTSSPLETGNSVPVFVYVGERSTTIAAAQNNNTSAAIAATVNYRPSDDLGSGVLNLELPNLENDTWANIVLVLSGVLPYEVVNGGGRKVYGTMEACEITMSFAGQDDAGEWGATSKVKRTTWDMLPAVTCRVAGKGMEILLSK